MIKILKINSPKILKNKIHDGDYLLSINDNQINDIFDFQYYQIADTLKLKFKTQNNKIITINLKGDIQLDLTLEDFEIKRCRNKCIFCFVDQMPKGLRPELYIKDEDYRMSFLYGNFITGTSLSDDEINKIIKMNLSPIYLSVHTTDPDLRKFMLKNPNAANIIQLIEKFSNAGIDMHTQLVLCPGINDGDYLKKSIEDLSKFYPNVLTIGVVPVGLTNFRNSLYPLQRYNKTTAKEVLKIIKEYQNIFLKKYNTRLVFPSDEFFILAEKKIPTLDYYEDLEQYENGIGMMAYWVNNLNKLKKIINNIKPSKKVKIGFVSGKLAAPIYKKLLHNFFKNENIDLFILSIENKLFGPSVTVTGLLSGHCIIEGVKNTKSIFDYLFIPQNVINHDKLFLDNLTINDIKNELKTEIIILDEELENLTKVLQSINK